MKLETRYSNHPNDVKHYTTKELREHFLIEEVFVNDEANLTYSHNDRNEIRNTLFKSSK